MEWKPLIVLIFASLVAIATAQEQRAGAEVETRAVGRGDDSKCSSRMGQCYHVDEYACAGGHYVKGLCSGGASRQCCQFRECKLMATPGRSLYDVEVYFINARAESASLYWMDWNKNEFYFTTIPGGYHYKVFSYPEHNWIARDERTGTLLWTNGDCVYTTIQVSPTTALITDSVNQDDAV